LGCDAPDDVADALERAEADPLDGRVRARATSPAARFREHLEEQLT
jgi:hypothetical protein